MDIDEAIAKSKIYGHYLCNMLHCKHDFFFLEVRRDSRGQIVWADNGEYFKELDELILCKPNKNMFIHSYQSFIESDFITEWCKRFKL